jgi:hypothetical protein
MAEFNWTVDDIKRAQRDFSNNFMRLDCIRTESYDVAIDCMTKCIEKKAADVQPVKHGRWFHINNGGIIYCSECENEAYWDTDYGQQLFDFCPYCGAKMIKGGDE